jgi:E3 ubiquitin-protein ligase UBR4
VKVLSHDFKILLKRLAYEDSFSRDSQGGGPEHNMHLVPFLVQMIHYHLAQGTGYMQYGASETARDKFTYA